MGLKLFFQPQNGLMNVMYHLLNSVLSFHSELIACNPLCQLP